MKNTFIKIKYILSEEGLTVFIIRLGKVLIVKVRRLFSFNKEIIFKWTKLKNIHKGKRAFLIGNGPSLNRLPLYLLRNEHSIGFNRINLLEERLNWVPNFYCTIDDRVLLDSVDEIQNNLSKYEAAFLPDIHPYNINFKKKFVEKDNLFWLFLEKLNFSMNLPYAGINKTVANVGLQILAYLGFSPIYIIGVDLDYKSQVSAKNETTRDVVANDDDDPNHFDPRYFGKGRNYHQPRMEETFLKFDDARKFFDSQNINVFNAGIGGKLESFKRVKFEDLFNYTDDEMKILFLKTFSAMENILSLEDFKILDDLDGWNPDMEKFSVPTDVGVRLINKAIFTHIPHGPFKNRYYFVKRTNNDNAEYS
ncbi:MAG: DUF115 domain-containing protein [Melioribacteraceae bacterium]|nr:DUF115 domain-containing protein [Melioribacteraceae bacterium]MCF8263495.1 DUF115 domain-containing protein [Melioribacteraceae bacterium]MCF8296951.1 DUF115 domain-containing protein [Saprospiraceae bacterium]